MTARKQILWWLDESRDFDGWVGLRRIGSVRTNVRTHAALPETKVLDRT